MSVFTGSSHGCEELLLIHQSKTADAPRIGSEAPFPLFRLWIVVSLLLMVSHKSTLVSPVPVILMCCESREEPLIVDRLKWLTKSVPHHETLRLIDLLD